MPQLWGDGYKSNTSFLRSNHLQYCVIHLMFSSLILYFYAIGIGALFHNCRKGLSFLYKNSESQLCNSLLKYSIFYHVVMMVPLVLSVYTRVCVLEVTQAMQVDILLISHLHSETDRWTELQPLETVLCGILRLCYFCPSVRKTGTSLLSF